MDILVVLALSALLQLLRRRRSAKQPSTPDTTPSSTPTVTPARSVARHWLLLFRAANGLLLALLCVVFALLPWPDAWAMSVMVAPTIRQIQTTVLRSLDVVTIAAVGAAVVEPLLLSGIRWVVRSIVWAVRTVCHTPPTIWRIARLFGLLITLIYWRLRCRLARRAQPPTSTFRTVDHCVVTRRNA